MIVSVEETVDLLIHKVDLINCHLLAAHLLKNVLERNWNHSFIDTLICMCLSFNSSTVLYPLSSRAWTYRVSEMSKKIKIDHLEKLSHSLTKRYRDGSLFTDNSSRKLLYYFNYFLSLFKIAFLWLIKFNEKTITK